MNTRLPEGGYSTFIRGMSLLVNGIGLTIYLLLIWITVSDVSGQHLIKSLSPLNWWLVLNMWGLAPLIVITYFLGYVKKADLNVMGIFIVTPVAIFVHYVTVGIAVHARFLGERTDAILFVIELLAAAAVVALVERRGRQGDRGKQDSSMQESSPM